MAQELLRIEDLHASINGIKILNGLNFSMKEGEIHAIMGPNGSGKSTLAKIVAGHPAYEVNKGSIYLYDQDITQLEAEVRAHLGIFLAFQYPIEIPGVSNADFLRLSYNAKRKSASLEEIDPLAFFELVNKKLQTVGMDSKFLTRNVNEGFSGGEKKRNEILQMALLNPSVSILDETDSGLDIDALRIVANGINKLVNSKNSLLLITHYQRLLDYITPDFVHIMKDGRITYTGDAELAHRLERDGYDLVVT